MVGKRPSHASVDGWVCFVGLHDRLYRAERAKWRQRLAAAHPDRTGARSAWRFLGVARRFKTWQAQEAKWYARLSLGPPGLGRGESAKSMTVTVKAMAPHNALYY